MEVMMAKGLSFKDRVAIAIRLRSDARSAEFAADRAQQQVDVHLSHEKRAKRHAADLYLEAKRLHKLADITEEGIRRDLRGK